MNTKITKTNKYPENIILKLCISSHQNTDRPRKHRKRGEQIKNETKRRIENLLLVLRLKNEKKICINF